MAPPPPPRCVGARAGWPLADGPVVGEAAVEHGYDTPMLLSAPPLEHTLPRSARPPKVEFTTYTGRFCDWLNARMAAPPRQGRWRRTGCGRTGC